MVCYQAAWGELIFFKGMQSRKRSKQRPSGTFPRENGIFKYRKNGEHVEHVNKYSADSADTKRPDTKTAVS